MTTAADIVGDAALAAGIGDLYNPLDASQSALALRTLNRLLDSWSNESLVVFNTSEDNFAMTPGQAAYSTSLLVARPMEVLYTFVRLSGVDYPIELIGPDDYARIGYKATTGLPAKCYFNSGMPQGTLTYFPIPSMNYQAYVGYRAPLANLTSLTTAISLPPGYETALVYGLATMLAPMFGTDPTNTCVFHAKSAKDKIKPQNESLNEAKIGIPLGRGLFNIFMGQ